MLFFRFNTDKMVAFQQECIVTKYRDEKTIGSKQRETCMIEFEQIKHYFFKKLENELSLSNIVVGHALYDVIGVPMDAFSIDDEVIGNFEGAIKFVLSEYAKLPINELNNKSLNDFGIDIEFCSSILNSEINLKINEYMQENNAKYLTEEVLWKNMTNDEKVNKFLEYLIKINSENNELIVVDPYIFSCKENNYCEMLSSIFNRSKAKKIVIVTDKKNYQKKSFNKISNKTNIPISVKYSKDYHDRFWIANRKKGFYTGTSLNGVGRKISLINFLSYDDITVIIDELCKQLLVSQ